MGGLLMAEPVLQRLNNDFDKAVNLDDFRTALRMIGHTNAAMMHALEELSDHAAESKELFRESLTAQKEIREDLGQIKIDTHLQIIKANERIDELSKYYSEKTEMFERFILKIEQDRQTLKTLQKVAGVVFLVFGAWVGTVIKEVASTPAKINIIIDRLDKLEKMESAK